MAARKKTPASKKQQPAKKKQPAAKVLGNDPFARGAATRELKTAPPPAGPRTRTPTPELQERLTGKTVISAALAQRAPSGKAIITAALAEAPSSPASGARRGSAKSGAVAAPERALTTPQASPEVGAPTGKRASPGATGTPTARGASPEVAAPTAKRASPGVTAAPTTHHASPEVVAAPALVVAPTAHHASPDFTVDPTAHRASPQLSVDPEAHHASPDVAADPAAHHASPHLPVDPEAHHGSPALVVDPVAHHAAPSGAPIDGPVPHFSSPSVVSFASTPTPAPAPFSSSPTATGPAPSPAPFASSPTATGPAPTPSPAPFASSPTLVSEPPVRTSPTISAGAPQPSAPPFASSPTLVADEALAPVTPRLPSSADTGLLSALLGAVRAGVGLASRATQLDHWGKDATLASSLRPLGELLYDRYFRVQVEGAQHLPAGPCVIVANHAGALPLDGPMLHLALRRERPELPEARWLLEDQIFHAPFAGVLANRLGAVRANPENAHRLLDEGRPIIVFPEGFHGLSKPFSERYQLRRFGRGGYVKIAVRRGVPIVPVAIVGGEESMPLLAKVPAKFLGVEHLPITPLPLPTRWFIRFSPPFDLSDAPPQAETNLAWVERTNLSVRDQIEAMITDLLKQRQSVF